MKFLILAIIAVLVIGCAKKPKPEAQENVLKGPFWHDAEPGTMIADAPSVLENPDYEANVISCNFGLNSADIDAIAQAHVLAWADYLKRTLHRTRIVGHACPLGEAGYNYDLGMRRARAVESMLIGAGIDPIRITVESRGESEPITTNPREYERNRRVEFSILKGQP